MLVAAQRRRLVDSNVPEVEGLGGAIPAAGTCEGSVQWTVGLGCKPGQGTSTKQEACTGSA